MDEFKLRNNIKKNLKAKGIDLTDQDINNLYELTISNIQQMLDKEDSVDIPEFGLFWRRNTQPLSVTFFKPTDRLIDRINTSKK